MTVAPSSAEVTLLAVPADDANLTATVPAAPTLFDPPRTIEAVGLTWETMPPWLQVATFQRWSRPQRTPPSWQALYRSAIDVAPFDMAGRAVLRVLVDWHTHGVDNFTRSLARDVAPRVPCTPYWCQQTVRLLAAGGWLDVQPRPGSASLITLTVPVDKPLDTEQTPQLSRGVPPNSVGGTPQLSAGDPPTQLATQGEQGEQGEQGRSRSSSRDAIEQRAVDKPMAARRRRARQR